jgi:hypothetical protein
MEWPVEERRGEERRGGEERPRIIPSILPSLS